MIRIGVDEVGRGALAGPITGVAYACREKGLRDWQVRDSKACSKGQREAISARIREASYGFWTEAWVSPQDIDRRGIEWANNEVLKASIIGLISLNFDVIEDKDIEVYVDGPKPVLGLPRAIKQHCIVGGDKKIYECSAASIIAKTERDNWMRNLTALNKITNLPESELYGWYYNVGYGTDGHKEAIKKYGLTDLHRRTFVHT